MSNVSKTKRIVRSAIIASLYVVLTILLSPISYGAIQLRVSEALCVLPLFFPESVVGLSVGCFIANLFGGNVFDIIFGTLATTISATLSYFLLQKTKSVSRKLVRCILFNVIFNAVFVPLAFYLNGTETAYLLNAFYIALSEAVTLGIFGSSLYFAIIKLKPKTRIFD